jgi:hypothetical protein
MDTDEVKRTDSGLTRANLCCLSGVVLVLYAAFLLHSAVGFFITGLSLFAWGVHLHRVTKDSVTKRR